MYQVGLAIFYGFNPPKGYLSLVAVAAGTLYDHRMLIFSP